MAKKSSTNGQAVRPITPGDVAKSKGTIDARRIGPDLSIKPEPSMNRWFKLDRRSRLEVYGVFKGYLEDAIKGAPILVRVLGSGGMHSGGFYLVNAQDLEVTSPVKSPQKL